VRTRKYDGADLELRNSFLKLRIRTGNDVVHTGNYVELPGNCVACLCKPLILREGSLEQRSPR
jgi:hypothetical protein